MKTLGIVGGLGPESSALYYRLLQREVRSRRGGRHTARLILDSLDFHDLAEAQDRGDTAAMAKLVTGSALRLEAAGAERVLIACVTAHCVAGAVESALGVPLLHVGDAAGAALRRDGRRRVALLGTRFTLEGGFLAERIAARNGVAALVPEPDERARLHAIIVEELVAGEVRAATRSWIAALAGTLAARGADALLLACTELSLLFPEPDDATDLALPLYDATRLHVDAAAYSALGGEPADRHPEGAGVAASLPAPQDSRGRLPT